MLILKTCFIFTRLLELTVGYVKADNTGSSYPSVFSELFYASHLVAKVSSLLQKNCFDKMDSLYLRNFLSNYQK